MKDVQCYELFGGIALKNHTFSFSRIQSGPFPGYELYIGTSLAIIVRLVAETTVADRQADILRKFIYRS